MLSKFPRKLFAAALVCALVFGQALAASPMSGVNFNLRTVDGGSITSEMLRGDVVVLAFGASWLPLSRAQVQGVQGLADEYKDRDLRVYWVSTDSEKPQSKNYASDEQIRSFARKNGLKVAVLRDPDGALFKTLGVERNQLPAVVILDREGNVADTIGGLNPDPDSGTLTAKLAPRLTRFFAAQ
jgi:peroxiredoxin